MPDCPHYNRNTFEILAVDVGGAKYNCVQCSAPRAVVLSRSRASNRRSFRDQSD